LSRRDIIHIGTTAKRRNRTRISSNCGWTGYRKTNIAEKYKTQAESTSSAKTEVIGKIGFGVDTKVSEQILEGKIDPIDITDDEWSQFLLTSMRRHSKELKIDITKDRNDGQIQEVERKNKHLAFR
jgi:hypothetical protein